MQRDRWLLLLLAAVNFTHITDLVVMMPLGDVLMRSLRMTTTNFGIVVSAYTFAAGISSLLAVFFIDKIDRKHALLVTYTGFVIGTIACGFAPSYGWLVAARAFTGFFGGMIGALVLAVVSDRYPIEMRGKAMGVITGALAAAIIIGLPGGLVVGTRFGWNVPFWILGGFGVMVGLGLALRMPNMRQHLSQHVLARSMWAGYRLVFRDKNQLLALFISSLLIFAQFIVIPFIVPYLIRNVGLAETDLQYLLLIGGAIALPAAPLIGRLTDWLGPQKTFRLLVFVAIAFNLSLTHLPQVSVWIVLPVIAGFFVFVLGQLVPAQTLITAATGPESRGSFMSLKSAAQQFGAAYAGYLGGVIISAGPTQPIDHYPWLGYIATAGGLLALLLIPRLKVAQGND